MDIQNSSIQGFGTMDAAKVDALQKALSISQNYGTTAPNALTQGGALSVEDLDRTLKLVTSGLEHLKVWKDLIKEKVTQPVAEYNVQNSYGQSVSPFFSMGNKPQQTDAQYAREIVQVKYLGTQGSVMHDLTLIQAAHGPVIAREVKNKTVELLTRNERSLMDADSAINPLEYDGIEKQIVSKAALSAFQATEFAGYDTVGISNGVVIDVRAPFTADVAEEMALSNVNNFGMAMDCYLGTDVHSKFSREYYSVQRTLPGATLISGNRVKEHDGSLNFRYKPSLFQRPRVSPLPVAISASAAPTVGTPTEASDSASQFAAADAGNYSYQISLVYADGETLPSAPASATVAQGQSVSATISFSGAPLYANVFRSDKGAIAAPQFIGRIAVAASGSSNVIDRNAQLPGAGKAYLLMHDADTLTWKQLGSMIKYDLAVTTTSYQWLQLMYGTPLISAARKHTIAKNLTLA
jgi:hypothetical protein